MSMMNLGPEQLPPRGTDPYQIKPEPEQTSKVAAIKAVIAAMKKPKSAMAARKAFKSMASGQKGPNA